MNFILDRELNRACRIIFGPETVINHDFLCYIQPSGAKSAFREKAFLTHPDCLGPLDKVSLEKTTGQFIEVRWAYDHISNFFKKRDKNISLPHRAKKTKQKPGSNVRPKQWESRRHYTYSNTHFYTGLIPRRKLLFGEFLYYSRLISWEAFIKAIILQRKDRPSFGDIAKDWNYLTESWISTIMSGKRVFEPIGEAATRMNILSQFRVNSILNYQRQLQKPIGEYFIENGYILKPRINTHHQGLQKHNSLYPPPNKNRFSL